jgi:hypothetical protein
VLARPCVSPKRRMPQRSVGEIRCVEELSGSCVADQRRPHSTAASAPRRGFIVFNGGFLTIDCVVHYASNSGANLKFEALVFLQLLKRQTEL